MTPLVMCIYRLPHANQQQTGMYAAIKLALPPAQAAVSTPANRLQAGAIKQQAKRQQDRYVCSAPHVINGSKAASHYHLAVRCTLCAGGGAIPANSSSTGGQGCKAWEGPAMTLAQPQELSTILSPAATLAVPIAQCLTHEADESCMALHSADFFATDGPRKRILQALTCKCCRTVSLPWRRTCRGGTSCRWVRPSSS